MTPSSGHHQLPTTSRRMSLKKMKWRRRKKTKDRHQEEEGWRQDSWRKDIRKARKNDHYLRMETFGHQVLHLRKKIGAANLTKINHRRHREVLALSSFFIMFLSLSLLFWDINFFTWTSYGLCTISCCCCITERKKDIAIIEGLKEETQPKSRMIEREKRLVMRKRGTTWTK